MPPSDTDDGKTAADGVTHPSWPGQSHLESIENPADGTVTIVDADRADTPEATTYWLTIDTEFVVDRESMA